MAIDLTDYTEGWLFNETDRNTDALGVRGVQNLTKTGTGGGPQVGSDGVIDDPVGNFGVRRDLQPIGSVSNNIYFFKNQALGDIFDIRGLTSCTIAGWYKIRLGETGEPYFFTIHNPSAANGQALLISTRHIGISDGGANDDPGVLMAKGDTPFNFKIMSIGNDAASVPEDTWQFIAAGYDAARNKVFGFWGRGPGDFYYREIDGHVGGFGYAANNGTIAFGQYMTGGGDVNGVNSEFRLDQTLWWNGRALTQAECQFLWNNHAARRINELVEVPSSTGTRFFLFNPGRRK